LQRVGGIHVPERHGELHPAPPRVRDQSFYPIPAHAAHLPHPPFFEPPKRQRALRERFAFPSPMGDRNGPHARIELTRAVSSRTARRERSSLRALAFWRLTQGRRRRLGDQKTRLRFDDDRMPSCSRYLATVRRAMSMLAARRRS